MARLRIRIELSRGGLGVPLRKAASVIGEAQKFLHSIGEDIHLDSRKGEWLGFEFDRESLDFTAEFVGPATAKQVAAFNAAFDGTTSLRRLTIAQFARIADAIAEDEVIGFGLYQSDDEVEPAEWRCLSRRDALLIAEGIQVLTGAVEDSRQESHLPAIEDRRLGARLFGDRRDRAPEQGRVVDYVREVETTLSNRIDRVENRVEQHSGLIADLRSHSSATEESFRNLLATIETFCGQATRQIEGAAPLALQHATRTPAPPRLSTMWVVIVAAGVILAGSGWLWFASDVGQPPTAQIGAGGQHARDRGAAPAVSGTAPKTAVETPREPVKLKEEVRAAPTAADAPATSSPVEPAANSPVEPAANTEAMLIELEATEPSWVSLVDVHGNKLITKLLSPGEVQSIELQSPALLRTGNAGGLAVRVNGKSVGPLGPSGKVRQLKLKGGSYEFDPTTD